MATFADIFLDPTSVLTWLIVGLIAGCLAGVVMKGSGYGMLRDVIVGLIGAVIGGFLLGQFITGTPDLLMAILVAFLGACLLIAVMRFVTGNRGNL